MLPDLQQQVRLLPYFLWPFTASALFSLVAHVMTGFALHCAVGRQKIRIEMISDERNRQARNPAMHVMHGSMNAFLFQRLLLDTVMIVRRLALLTL